jgi:hypothetical protein
MDRERTMNLASINAVLIILTVSLTTRIIIINQAVVY